MLGLGNELTETRSPGNWDDENCKSMKRFRIFHRSQWIEGHLESLPVTSRDEEVC